MHAFRQHHQGFSLLEIIMVAAIVALVAILAWPTYQQYVRQTRLSEAQSALITNSRVLERFYSQNHKFKINSTTWMPLPITETSDFCLRLQGNPSGTNSNETYTLKAVAFNPQQEPRVIKINQDLTIMVCEQSSSRCSETTAFFAGGSSVDKSCTIMGNR